MLPPPEIRNPKSAITHLWPLLLPLLLILPGLAGFPYASPQAQFSDFSITHYPNALFLQSSILEHGQIPLWSPTILSGYPFAANPLASLWYPPHWFAILMPLPLGLNLVTVIHFLWAGLGIYLFLRSQDFSHPTALFGALAFEAIPKLFAHYGAGHLTTVYAVAWIPWLLLAGQARQPRWLSPGIVLALIFLADVRWAASAGVLWLAYSLAQGQFGWFFRISSVAKQTGLAALLAAPLTLPLIEYTRLSTRSSLQATDVLALSLPPARLLGWLFPDFGGFHEWMLYPGVIVFILALLALVLSERRKWFWIGVFLLSTLYALGNAIPGLALLAKLPGFSLLRVPPRAFVLTSFALILLACFTLEAMLNRNLDEKTIRRLRLVLAGLAALSLSMAIAVWVLTDSFPLQFVWGAVGVVLLAVLAFIFVAGRISPRFFWLVVIFISLFDLVIVGSSLFVSKPAQAVLSEQAGVAAYLAQKPAPFRVYSPSYSLPQQTAAVHGLELADGVDPLQLAAYVEYMTRASGVSSDGYSVTIPPFASEDSDLATANQAYQPDVDVLAALNVSYVASEFDLDDEDLALEEQFGETRLYVVTSSVPRAYILQSQEVLPVEQLQLSPNRITMTTNHSGLLVLAELAYPGWQVYVDGQRAELQTYQGIFRAVEIGGGLHEVEFIFRPTSVYTGMAISLLALFVLTWKGYRSA